MEETPIKPLSETSKQPQSGKEFSDALARILEAADTLEPHLVLGKKWLLEVVKPKVDAEISDSNTPEEIEHAYTQAVASFVRNIQGVVGKILSLLPNYEMHTGQNSGNLILSRSPEDSIKHFLDRAYAEDALWDGLAQDEYTPEPAYDAFTRYFAKEFDDRVRETVFNAPDGLSANEMTLRVHAQVDNWIEQTLGRADVATVHRPGSFFAFVYNALQKARQGAQN